MQLTIDIKNTAVDKVMYLLDNLKSDVKIISKIDYPLDIDIIEKEDSDYNKILISREERKKPRWLWRFWFNQLELILYQIKLHKKVIKFINKQNTKDKSLIKQKLELLKYNPYPNNENLDLKKITNYSCFRLRIRNFRFVYDVVENELIIYFIDANNRGDIY